MKKLFLSLVAAIVCATTAYAQDVYVATLNHEGVISEFYGEGAFKKAYNAAVDGDVITLSAGKFTGNLSSTKFNKALTIRGAGIVDNKELGLASTSINTINFEIKESTAKLYIEGVILEGTTNIRNTIDNAEFVKCSFSKELSGTYTDCTFTDCYIHKLVTLSSCNNVIFNNCFISYPGLGSSGSNYYYNATFFNCFIATASNTNYYPKDCNYTNCILALNYNLDPSNKVDYCVGIALGYYSVFYELPDNPTCYSVKTSIFKSWNKASSKTDLTAESFELSETGKVYTGVDGTEIGMLGGNYPYNPTVSIPRITKCEVAEKATADGKLSVNIEVTTPAGE